MSIANIIRRRVRLNPEIRDNEPIHYDDLRGRYYNLLDKRAELQREMSCLKEDVNVESHMMGQDELQSTLLTIQQKESALLSMQQSIDRLRPQVQRLEDDERRDCERADIRIEDKKAQDRLQVIDNLIIPQQRQRLEHATLELQKVGFERQQILVNWGRRQIARDELGISNPLPSKSNVDINGQPLGVKRESRLH